jgi:hypothetical protein
VSDEPQLTETPPRSKSATAGVAGRAGMFVAGYFTLGLLNTIFWNAVGHPASLSDDHRVRALVVGLVATAMTAGMLFITRLLRDGEFEPFAVMAALGAAEYITVAAVGFGRSAGFDDRPLVWFVLALALPAVVAILLWLPHPVLGLSVAVGVVVAACSVPIGVEGTAEVATRAFLIGIAGLALGVVVDLRTLTRAGSWLHYLGVAGFAIGTIATLMEIEALPGVLVATGLAMIELVPAILLRRKSWAYLGWVTFAVALAEFIGWALGSFGVSTRPFSIAAPLLIVSAIVLRRNEEKLRDRFLSELPPDLVGRFPR